MDDRVVPINRFFVSDVKTWDWDWLWEMLSWIVDCLATFSLKYAASDEKENETAIDWSIEGRWEEFNNPLSLPDSSTSTWRIFSLDLMKCPLSMSLYIKNRCEWNIIVIFGNPRGIKGKIFAILYSINNNWKRFNCVHQRTKYLGLVTEGDWICFISSVSCIWKHMKLNVERGQ